MVCFPATAVLTSIRLWRMPLPADFVDQLAVDFPADERDPYYYDGYDFSYDYYFTGGIRPRTAAPLRPL